MKIKKKTVATKQKMVAMLIILLEQTVRMNGISFHMYARTH